MINFRKTLSELKKYSAMPIKNDRDRAGIIQAFEFTFEQAWKSVQKIAAGQGATLGNPKSAFSYALQNQWIKAGMEQDWLKLITDRNLTAHTYQEDLAAEVLDRIQSKYISMFENLLTALESEAEN